MAGLTGPTPLLSACVVNTQTTFDQNAYSSTLTPQSLMIPYSPPSSTATNTPMDYGLLQNLTGPKTTNDSNAYMKFAQLNDVNQRNSWLSARYTTLVNANVIPQPPSLTAVNTNTNVINNLNRPPHSSEPLATYTTNLSKFVETLSKEYCYYQNNYMYALNNFLTAYSTSSITGGTTGNLTQFRDTALELNAKVNTLIAFINYLSNERISQLNGLKLQLDTQNNRIARSTSDLNVQATILSNNNSNNVLYKQMVDYTAEKNRANQNLLAVYFTLNVVAIAGLFVIARIL
jgi:hypothetical protein